MSLAISSHPRFAEHRTSRMHPERPDRIRTVHRAVREAGLIASLDPFPEFAIDLGLKPLSVAPLIELEPPQTAGDDVLRLVHAQPYIDRIESICRAGGGVLDQGDTPVGASSCDIARLAVGSILSCCDAVMTGVATRAFAAVRPPGHHAEPDRPMGFCLFANLAIGTRYVQKRYDVQRIAIVDFDVHHGNGTQACFYDDPSVLFISLHQDPRTLYPGSGHEWERGAGAGEGFTLNVPMNPGADDADYLNVMSDRVIPAIDTFARKS